MKIGGEGSKSRGKEMKANREKEVARGSRLYMLNRVCFLFLIKTMLARESRTFLSWMSCWSIMRGYIKTTAGRM